MTPTNPTGPAGRHRVGVGVLGSGFMGRTWATVAATQLPDARLVGVTGGRRAPALAADLNCRPYTDLAAMLEDPAVEIVVLATPPAGHADQADAAAAAGKHLLIEKPMANSVAECRRIAAACASTGVAAAVVSQHRFRAAPRAAWRVVADGGIGTVTMIRAIGPEVGFWDTEKTMDQWKLDPRQQSAFASWGAHACDLVRWFVADEPDLAFAIFSAYTDAPPPGRSAMATYRFGRGAMAQLWMSYDIPPPGLGSGLQLELIGTDGIVELDSYGTVRVGDAGGWRTEFEQPPFDASDPADPVRLMAYRDQLADLIDAAATGRSPLVSAAEGSATTAMLEAAERSARNGMAVRLPLSD